MVYFPAEAAFEFFDQFIFFCQGFFFLWDRLFDFSKGIVFLDKELQQLFQPENEEYSPKVVDKLANVFTREGKEEWVLIHVEIQAVYRKDFTRRMYNYFAFWRYFW